MKVEVAVLCSLSLIVPKVSVNVKQHLTAPPPPTQQQQNPRAQELRESRGGRPGSPAHNSLYGLCGRKATLNSNAPQQVTAVAGVTECS